jgi:hypothetical protein
MLPRRRFNALCAPTDVPRAAMEVTVPPRAACLRGRRRHRVGHDGARRHTGGHTPRSTRALVVGFRVGYIEDELVVRDRRGERQDHDGRVLSVLDDRFIGGHHAAQQHRPQQVGVVGGPFEQRRPVSRSGCARLAREALDRGAEVLQDAMRLDARGSADRHDGPRPHEHHFGVGGHLVDHADGRGPDAVIEHGDVGMVGGDQARELSGRRCLGDDVVPLTVQHEAEQALSRRKALPDDDADTLRAHAFAVLCSAPICAGAYRMVSRRPCSHAAQK